MNFDSYVNATDLLEKTELEKVKYLLFFFSKLEGLVEMDTAQIRLWFERLNIGQPNISRLRRNLKTSKDFIKGSSAGAYKLHARAIANLSAEFPHLTAVTEEIVSRSSILPDAMYRTPTSRTYIVRLCEQVNASYEHHLFDCCAVIMRRLVEVLLIHAYQHNGIEGVIQNPDGTYKDLKVIIADACINKNLSLSRNAKSCLDTFRQLGNFAAHRITFTTVRDDIKNTALDFRATVEELMYKAGLRT
jgi:hypothetical protein